VEARRPPDPLAKKKEIRMKIKYQITARAVFVCLACVAVAWILTEFVWGATSGLVCGLSIVRNPEYQQKVTAFMKDKGASPTFQAEARKAYENLSQEDRQELMKMSKETLSGTNWFAVTTFVSVVVYGLVGFLGGFIARSWILVGLVPALSFLTNNPIIRFSMAKDLTIVQKVIVVLIAQFAICYILAYYGARLGLKLKQRKEMANKAIEASV
jgi:hypothetical protein